MTEEESNETQVISPYSTVNWSHTWSAGAITLREPSETENDFDAFSRKLDDKKENVLTDT